VEFYNRKNKKGLEISSTGRPSLTKEHSDPLSKRPRKRHPIKAYVVQSLYKDEKNQLFV
jgi:hypothetical protein